MDLRTVAPRWTLLALAGALVSTACETVTPLTADSIQIYQPARGSVPTDFQVSYTIVESGQPEEETEKEETIRREAVLRSAAAEVLYRYFPIAVPLSARGEQHAVVAIRGQWNRNLASGSKNASGPRTAAYGPSSKKQDGRFPGTYSTSVTIEMVENGGHRIESASGTATADYSSEQTEIVALANTCLTAIRNALDEIFRQKSSDIGWLKRLPKGRFTVVASKPEIGISSEQISSSGTGFFANSEGDIVTAKHVIEECPSISIVYRDVEFPAALRFADEEWDLAVVHADLEPASFAALAPAEELKMGKEMIAFGYPLQGLLAPTPSMTTGILSNPQVIKGRNDLLQITTPIQPGNSGGPLLGGNGAVCGVIVATLNALKLALATGALPQNVNFAISSTRLSQFLSDKGVPWTAVEEQKKLSAIEIAEQAKEYTVMVLCRGGRPQ
jgi:S1-C subfamily serine protease